MCLLVCMLVCVGGSGSDFQGSSRAALFVLGLGDDAA